MPGAGRHLVIAAGGTGGHMFPAQALAEEMLARGWRVSLSTDVRGARYAEGFPREVRRMVVSAASPSRGGLAARALAPARIAAGVLGAVSSMARARPDAVAGFGGYPALPALAAAWLLGIPRLIHEQNAIPGRVNRLFARRVQVVACGMWPTALPDGTVAVHVGNPVRRAVLRRAASPYTPPGDWPLSVLVLGGSQGARALSDVLPAALARLPEALRTRLRVAHQARPEDVDRVAAHWERAGIRAEVASFFQDVPARMAEAQLVISRAGASTLAELTVIGRPMILVPYGAAAGDHQTANARAMVQAGAAIMIPESRLDLATLSQHTATVLGSPEVASRMAAAARAAGRPQAAADLGDLVEVVAAREQPEVRT